MCADVYDYAQVLPPEKLAGSGRRVQGNNLQHALALREPAPCAPEPNRDLERAATA